MPSELTDLEVMQVDLVGKAANRRKWLVLKAEESGLPVEILEELASTDDTDGTEPVAEAPVEDATKEDVTEEESKGGDSVANDAELKKAQDELEALRKASADKDALLKAAEDAKAEALKKAADAEKLVKAERRTARGKELEPLCKSAQVDVEKMLDLEERDPETAKYLFEKMGALTKQVDELLKREDGSARHDERATTFDERIQQVAKEKGISIVEAGEIVAKSEPELLADRGIRK